jgi:hypothetical protein
MSRPRSKSGARKFPPGPPARDRSSSFWISILTCPVVSIFSFHFAPTKQAKGKHTAKEEYTQANKDITNLKEEMSKTDLDDKVRADINSFLSSVAVAKVLTNRWKDLTNALKNCKMENHDAVLKEESPRAVVAAFAHEGKCLELLQKFRVSAPSNAPHTLTEAVNKLLHETLEIDWIKNPTVASTLWKEAEPYAKGPSDGTMPV